MSLYETFYAAIKEVPKGEIASYSSVAKACGLPRGAQIVGWALHRMPADQAIPWHRIVNQAGRISIENSLHPADEQMRLLEGEGIVLVKENGYYTVVDPPWHIFNNQYE